MRALRGGEPPRQRGPTSRSPVPSRCCSEAIMVLSILAGFLFLFIYFYVKLSTAERWQPPAEPTAPSPLLGLA